MWLSVTNFLAYLISELLLNQFKGRFLGPYSTDSNWNGDICPGNICPHDICPYQEYLRTWFWWNFKDRILGTSRTDSNFHIDICRGNVCPRDICPYQEYLSCYWPDFDETLQVGSWEYLEQIPTVRVNISPVTNTIGLNFKDKARVRSSQSWKLLQHLHLIHK